MEAGIYSEVERMYENLIKREPQADNTQVAISLYRMA